MMRLQGQRFEYQFKVKTVKKKSRTCMATTETLMVLKILFK